MLQSMTGYGIAHRETDHYSATVEIKSLNSKTLDLSLRLPRFLQDRELEIRNLVTKSLVRGKVNFSLDFVRPRNAVRAAAGVNQEILLATYRELERAADLVGASKDQLFTLALNMPGVVQSGTEALAAENEEEIAWDELLPLVHEALERLNQFRQDEGQTLTSEILSYVETIRAQLTEIERHDPERIEQVRQRLQQHLADLTANEHFNVIRFEQEVLYYVEKLDIAEEKVRLASHLNYFAETTRLPESAGKKLSFIAQEIGREINTIGSKANDSTIQHLVVGMKEELEKIKEQINNIL
ncbi:YicC/YloC family endoribonuclease [Hymenobacter sp. GOD-10R]|uniref:YicC/YloC family endoribonuclease n=1 Tax=Hymenobacter sp. GOD-10R TaxID=3093922 RepID=UPI002D79646E|nr:YicC/YloC family endoribonuclease [Hymenobacter sp. GOD-10R]WRQ29215.1 YicC/YloC family endoribonuclease [Hymenobacter sp. GOD-10R]